MDKPTVILTVGLSGSGKSTWAKKYIQNDSNIKIVCKDDLRSMLDNKIYTKANEKFVNKVRDVIILEAVNEGKSIIVADTNLCSKHEKHIKQLVGNKAHVVNKYFLDIPIETCIKQDLQRERSVGKDVIIKQYYDFICKPIKPVTDSTKTNCIIVDLDGTLAINNHNRSYFDASTADKDDVCNEVLELINKFQNDHTIIFCTGREKKYSKPTIEFLNNNGIINPIVFMRSTGDSRKDYVVKEELYKEHIEPYYKVKFVIDDRPSVVRYWHKLGLFVFKVGREYDF